MDWATISSSTDRVAWPHLVSSDLWKTRLHSSHRLQTIWTWALLALEADRSMCTLLLRGALHTSSAGEYVLAVVVVVANTYRMMWNVRHVLNTIYNCPMDQEKLIGLSEAPTNDPHIED